MRPAFLLANTSRRLVSLPSRHLVIGAVALFATTGSTLSAQAPGSKSGASLNQLFEQGAAAYGKQDYATTITRFEELLKTAQAGPALEPVYFTIANAKLRKGDTEGAVTAFQRYLQLYPTGAQADDAQALLAQALIKAGRIPDALATLARLQNGGGAQGMDNYAALAGLTVEIADSLLDEKKAAEALALLQTVPDRTQIIERQGRRIRELEQLHRQAIGAAGSLGAETTQAALRDTFAARLADAREVLKKVEENPAFDLPRLLRQGRAYLTLGQPWEAIVVYQEILARFPESPDRAYGLHGLIFAWQAADRKAEAQALCQTFIDTFPTHALATEIALLGGQLALESQQATVAEKFFGTAIDKSKGVTRESVIFQLGLARFSLGAWAGAREIFDLYLREFPKGEYAENAAYRSAVSWFLDVDDIKRYEKAEKALKAFIQANPQSTYLPDAYYRLAICKFAFQEYEQTVIACDEWEKRFPINGLLPEVLSLRGDVLKSLNAPDRALETYLRAASTASTDDVLSYTLTEAARLLEAKKDWARLSSVFRTQVERQPESPLVFGWYYWVARADARAGKPSEAWDFLAARIGPALGDATREDVEKMLQLMAQIRARQKPAANESPAEPGADLRTQLQPAPEAAVAEARLRYYKATWLRLARKPAEADQIILGIGRELPPDGLSAPLLAECGDALLKANDTERAASFFEALLKRFPGSAYRDYAYVGLGDLALARGEPAMALKSYEDSIDVAGAQNRLREATVGKARALFALERLDEAAKLFEEIAATKEWRGEATALSLHHLGLIAAKKGDQPKAIAFFQRVFVSQGRYSEWVARAYLESGRAFEALGKTTDAVATYREMLRNERLRDRPEIALANQRLAALVPQ